MSENLFIYCRTSFLFTLCKEEAQSAEMGDGPNQEGKTPVATCAVQANGVSVLWDVSENPKTEEPQ